MLNPGSRDVAETVYSFVSCHCDDLAVKNRVIRIADCKVGSDRSV